MRTVRKSFVAKSDTTEFVVFGPNEISNIYMVYAQVANAVNSSQYVTGCYLNAQKQWIAVTDSPTGSGVGVYVNAIAYVNK